MKKLAFISMLCLCFILLISCNSADEPIDIFTDESRPLPSPEEQIASCEHVLGEWRTFGATNCITEGTEKRQCKFCPYEETIAVFGEHSYVGATCEFCGTLTPTANLRFEKDNSNDGYMLIIDDQITDSILVIPEEHNSKPVTRINQIKPARSVREVYIPKSLVVIDRGAFANMTNLEVVHIPQDSVLYRIDDGAFLECTSLKEISFENCKLLSILGPEVFKNCSSLKTVKLPEKLKDIGGAAFKGCVSLENINCLNKISYISASMFEGCTGLKNIRIPDSITEIHEYAFSNSGLEHVALPQSLTTLGRGVFYRCKSLQTVELNGSITEIFESTFFECSSLVEISASDNVLIAKIGKKAFAGCVSIQTLDFKIQGLAEIASDAFDGCENLENIPK